MSWFLTIPRNKTDTELRDWIRNQVDQGTPRQIIHNHMFELDVFSLSVEELQAISKVESELFRVMVDRNLTGKSLESAGKVDEAIQLYEANVDEWFAGDHPYDRLRVIYTRRKQHSDAIRVCRQFVKVADWLISQGSKRGDLRPKRKKFKEWIKKLEKKPLS